MRAILVSQNVYNGNAKKFNEELNKALEQIESEEGYIKDKKYSCKSDADDSDSFWHSVLIFYEIVPTRKVITEKHK